MNKSLPFILPPSSLTPAPSLTAGLPPLLLLLLARFACALHNRARRADRVRVRPRRSVGRSARRSFNPYEEVPRLASDSTGLPRAALLRGRRGARRPASR